jgi:hypothetical protein
MAGRAGENHSTGATANKPTPRTTHGQGITATAPPSTDNTAKGQGGAAHVDAAHGHCAIAPNTASIAPTAAAAQSHSGGTSTPNMAKGVTSNVTHGIANKLANMDTQDTCPNHTKVMGTKATVIKLCSRNNCRHHAQHRSRQRDGLCAWVDGASLPIKIATATKLSQKPACNSAQGSQHTTANIAQAHTTGQGQRRTPQRKATTTASIRTVRCAGTAQPENTA